MAGTVNISRDLWDDTTFKDSEMSQREAWVWMIVNASWKARSKRVGTLEVDLERGQMAVSTRFMAAAWMWSEARVRRYLDMLENRRMISRVTDAGINVITICNYDKYQNGPRTGDAAKKRTATHQRRTSDANHKKGERRVKEEEKKDSFVSLPSGDGDGLTETHPEAPSAPKPKVPSSDIVAEAIDAYRATAQQQGWPVPTANITPTRRRAISARIKDAGGIEGWQIAIGKAAASDFLGQARPFSGFGIDWIAKPANFVKIMEGNYDDRASANNPHRRTSGSTHAPRGGRPGGIVGAAVRSQSGAHH